MIKPIFNYVEVERRNKFSLWINRPIYKIYKTTGGYIRNTNTGENMGQKVVLCMNLFDEKFKKSDIVTYDEDCYEIVEVNE